MYIKMFRNLSAKYYQENKEILQKKLLKDIKIFLRKKKKKSNNMVVNITKISQKIKKVSWLSLEKDIKNQKKRFLIIIRKHFNLENFALR